MIKLNELNLFKVPDDKTSNTAMNLLGQFLKRKPMEKKGATPNKYTPHQGEQEKERRLPIHPAEYVRQKYFHDKAIARGQANES